MSWDISTIKKRVRNLCSLQSTNDLSESNLLDYINRFYKWQLHKELKPFQLKTWYEIDLAAGTEEYDLAEDFYDTYVKVATPAYISETSGRKEYELSVYYNLEQFYTIWTEGVDYSDSDERGRPSSLLIYDNKLLFRKVPDDTYYLTMQAMRKPLVYVNGVSTTTSTEFVNDADVPENESWGQIVVYGTAKSILEELGDLASLQLVMGMYAEEKDNVHNMTFNWLDKTRARPKF